MYSKASDYWAWLRVKGLSQRKPLGITIKGIGNRT